MGMLFLKTSGIVGMAILGVWFLGILIYWLSIKLKGKKVKRNDGFLREYFKDFDYDNKLAVIDETPREVQVGSRFYLLKPLKYRQYTRICIMFAKVLQKIGESDISLENIDSRIGTVMEKSEEEFFKAMATVLYFSREPYDDNDNSIIKGIQEEYEHFRDKATVDQVSRVLEVVMMQNDIDRALKAFGRYGKKKVVM